MSRVEKDATLDGQVEAGYLVVNELRSFIQALDECSDFRVFLKNFIMYDSSNVEPSMLCNQLDRALRSIGQCPVSEIGGFPISKWITNVRWIVYHFEELLESYGDYRVPQHIRARRVILRDLLFQAYNDNPVKTLDLLVEWLGRDSKHALVTGRNKRLTRWLSRLRIKSPLDYFVVIAAVLQVIYQMAEGLYKDQMWLLCGLVQDSSVRQEFEKWQQKIRRGRFGPTLGEIIKVINENCSAPIIDAIDIPPVCGKRIVDLRNAISHVSYDELSRIGNPFHEALINDRQLQTELTVEELATQIVIFDKDKDSKFIMSFETISKYRYRLAGLIHAFSQQVYAFLVVLAIWDETFTEKLEQF